MPRPETRFSWETWDDAHEIVVTHEDVMKDMLAEQEARLERLNAVPGFELTPENVVALLTLEDATEE